MHTHIHSGNLFKSKEGVRSSSLLLMLINMGNTIKVNMFSFETNTSVSMMFSTFSFSIFSFYTDYFNKHVLSISHMSGTGLGPGNSVNQTDKNP